MSFQTAARRALRTLNAFAFFAVSAAVAGSVVTASPLNDPKQLDAYVGTYHTHAPDSPTTLTIRRKKNALTLSMNGQPEVRLYPSATGHYRARDVDLGIDFLPAPNGEVDGVLLHQNGQTVLALRPGYFSPVAAPAPQAPTPSPTPSPTPTPVPVTREPHAIT